VGENGAGAVKNIVLEIVLLLAIPAIVIWLGVIMFHMGGIAEDIQTIVDFIEATPTPSPSQ
jgi:hypothetical protein